MLLCRRRSEPRPAMKAQALAKTGKRIQKVNNLVQSLSPVLKMILSPSPTPSWVSFPSVMRVMKTNGHTRSSRYMYVCTLASKLL
mmetsp:Transcript_31476/g.50541  ORF Transcript_31476/g.50541 Transcript_31476/m.50541 type:complete len:85 (-) Transcript_31476:38-292(-)